MKMHEIYLPSRGEHEEASDPVERLEQLLET
jgi:hypothetical protein